MPYWWWRGRQQRVDEVWRAMTELGLEGDLISPEGAIGWLEGVELSLRLASDREFGAEVVELRGPALAGTSQEDASIEVRPAAPTGDREGPTGDPAFDAVVSVKAPPTRWLSAADPATRTILASAVRCGATWSGARWAARFLPPSPFSTPWTAQQLVSAARAIARAHPRWVLALGRDPRAGVLERIKDPVPGVRRRALKVAMEHAWVGEPELAPALSDYDPGVRLAAARALGRWEVVLDLARTGSRTWRVRAAVALARRSPDEPLRCELEELLISALPDPELAELAALALADMGSPLALGPLLTVTPPDARPAARAAAERIRNRAAPAGSLAIARVETGELSLAPAGGELSSVGTKGD